MAGAVVSVPAWRVNLSEYLLERRLDAFGGRPAVRTPDGVVSYAGLAERVGELAGGLAAWGLRRGERVALALPDSPLWIVAFLALVRSGATVALASPATPHARLHPALERANPRLILTEDEDLAPGVPRFDSRGLEHLIAAALADPGPAPTRADDACYMLLTSGSTGPSKWAVHRHGDIPACVATYGRHVLGLRPDDVTWSVAALPTSYGLGNLLYFPMAAGASSWITGEPPTPIEAEAACETGGVTMIGGVPTFWARLARHAESRRIQPGAFSDVRLPLCAGEPLPAAVWHRVRNALGLELIDGLGSSEATNLYLSNRPRRARPGTVGTVVPGFQLRVVDAGGARVGDGVAGELLVRGGSVMTGYLDEPEATARALRDGWLHTGDLVIRDPDGSFRFVGRVGERFKSGGFWVDPARVEAVLMEHAAVEEAAVSGVPDGDGINRVVALVVPRAGIGHTALENRLRNLAQVELAPHEAPRDYVFADRLPTAASGKVRRGDVQRQMLDAIRAVAS